MTGMLTAAMIASIIAGSLMRATPPAARMSDGNALEGHDGTRPGVLGDPGVLRRNDVHDDAALSIWARPFFVAQVEVSAVIGMAQSSAAAAMRGAILCGSDPPHASEL